MGITSVGREVDRQIANQLASATGGKYAAPKLAGSIHPHALPRFAVRQVCKKTIAEALKLEQALHQTKMKQRQKTVFAPAIQTSPQEAYAIRYEKSAHTLPLRYAGRTTNHAFGHAADRDLQRKSHYLELWQKSECSFEPHTPLYKM